MTLALWNVQFRGLGVDVQIDKTPQSVDDWLALGARHKRGSYVLKSKKEFSLSWDHTGFAVECYLKAAIMRKNGWNRWPDASERKDLWSHEPTALLKELGVTFEGLGKHPVRPHLKTILDWKRKHGYNPEAMPEKYAEQIYAAAFYSNGVVEWIVKTFHLPC